MSSSTQSSVEHRPWVCTVMGVDRTKCEWTITSSELLATEFGGSICTPSFYTGDGKEEWKFKLYPRGRTVQFENSVSCYLRLESTGQLGIHVELEVSMLKSNVKIKEWGLTHEFDKLKGWGWPDFVEQSELLDPECAGITIIIDCRTNNVIPKEQLSENLRLLFEDPKFSDMTIIVGDEKFPAHKSILSVRSSVFAAMFSHESMEENRKNEVKIEDLEPEVVKGMLEYIYTGGVGDLEVLASALLPAAEKYDLKVLKSSCENTLCKNLNVNNAAEFLMLAHLYSASKLKESAMKFIKDNLYDVLQTDGYKEINDNALLKDIISFGVHKN